MRLHDASTVTDDALPFADRRDAGVRLGNALRKYRGSRPLILGIPRGGVPVAAEVAKAVDGDLDIMVARKLGAPNAPELAVGAVTSNGAHYISARNVADLAVSQSYLDAVIKEKTAEAIARERLFREEAPVPDVQGRTVILVDDGLATGSTMIAAARSVRARLPAKLVIAVPVAPAETCESLREEADEIVCLRSPEFFPAVGMHYADFRPTEGEEVVRILREFRSAAAMV